MSRFERYYAAARKWLEEQQENKEHENLVNLDDVDDIAPIPPNRGPHGWWLR